MSVIVITKFPGQATNLERVAQGEHSETLERISDDAMQRGALHHLFVQDTDGSVLVIDEWETEEAFQTFFAAQTDIPRVAAEAGVTGPPTSTVYRILDTPGRF